MGTSIIQLLKGLLFAFSLSSYSCVKAQDVPTDPFLSSVVPVIDNSSVSSAVEEYTSLTMKSCVTQALEKRLFSPCHLVFGDIDLVVGFTTIFESAEVKFTLIVPTQGWFGFGVSEVGSMVGADIVVIEPKEDRSFKLSDRYSKDFVEPTIDKIQSWELLNATHETILIDEDCDKQSEV